jgi:hypothetical protein
VAHNEVVKQHFRCLPHLSTQKSYLNGKNRTKI